MGWWYIHLLLHLACYHYMQNVLLWSHAYIIINISSVYTVIRHTCDTYLEGYAWRPTTLLLWIAWVVYPRTFSFPFLHRKNLKPNNQRQKGKGVVSSITGLGFWVGAAAAFMVSHFPPPIVSNLSWWSWETIQLDFLAEPSSSSMFF